MCIYIYTHTHMYPAHEPGVVIVSALFHGVVKAAVRQYYVCYS